MFRYCCSINNTLLYVQGRVTRVETEIKMSLKLTSIVLYFRRIFQNDISYNNYGFIVLTTNYRYEMTLSHLYSNESY